VDVIISDVSLITPQDCSDVLKVCQIRGKKGGGERESARAREREEEIKEERQEERKEDWLVKETEGGWEE
jgi:hypothetical protein